MQRAAAAMHLPQLRHPRPTWQGPAATRLASRIEPDRARAKLRPSSVLGLARVSSSGRLSPRTASFWQARPKSGSAQLASTLTCGGPAYLGSCPRLDSVRNFLCYFFSGRPHGDFINLKICQLNLSNVLIGVECACGRL